VTLLAVILALAYLRATYRYHSCHEKMVH